VNPSQPSRQPSICFVALNAYNLLSGREDINHTGGAEVQQVRVASWLVRRGHPVSFVTLDHGQCDGITLNGITIRKAYAKGAGLRALRFVHPRWSGLGSAMARANADVYYQRGGGNETGQVALWCRLHRRSFVFGAASDADCDPALSALRSGRERILYRIGLRLADAVIAQTKIQQHLLQQNMRVPSILIHSCCPTPSEGMPDVGPTSRSSSSMNVLWVGRISREKRFEWLLDIAERCPEIHFDVVGASNTDSEYASLLTQRAAGIPNVKMHGRVSHAEMVQHYQRCQVLCCTSAYEGFPNTFLEAWALGVPVVSTFDPDGAVAANGLGWVSQGAEDIVACLKQMARSSEIRLGASAAARRYYMMHHTPDTCLPPFEHLLWTLAGRRNRARSVSPAQLSSFFFS
jgi:glycosyltransferase involved in cell wall biosynthesis